MSDVLKAVVLAAADAVDEARSELGRLDGVAGDGDHGMTMSIGARNVRRRFRSMPSGTSAADLVRQVGLAMSDVGGAIGPLYSTALTAVAVAIESAGAPPSGDIELLRGVAERAEYAVVELGHARPGDKTVIDALHPVVASLRVAEVNSVELRTALEAAAEAGEAGAASTGEMIARIGRASRLEERSRGLPDAGATSFAIVVRAMVDAYLDAPSGDR